MSKIRKEGNALREANNTTKTIKSTSVTLSSIPTIETYPAGQSVHELKEVSPVAAEKRPGGHMFLCAAFHTHTHTHTQWDK